MKKLLLLTLLGLRVACPSATDDDATANDDDATSDDDDATANDDDDATANDDDSTGDDDDSTGDDDDSAGDDDDSAGDDDDSASPGLPVGAACSEDVQCATGVCWDFADYDPYCFGAVCSDTCQTTAECVTIFTNAGASSPQSATCGPDNRCDPVSTGIGAFACAQWTP